MLVKFERVSLNVQAWFFIGLCVFFPLHARAESNQSGLAHVLSVDSAPAKQGYFFNVKLSSPDLGCRQYADWWEVLSENGKLLHRHVFIRSHANEQPFERSGGPIAIKETETVIVRAHMFPQGYGGVAMKGSVRSGFAPHKLPPSFAADVARQSPRETICTI